MAFWNEDPFAMPSRRHTFAGDPPLNRTSRSGTINGVNYHFETATSPGFSFGIMGSGSSRNRPQTTTSSVEQPRPRATGLLGTSLNLLGSLLASRQARTEANQRSDRRQRRRSSVDGLAYGNDYSDGGPESIISNSPRRYSPERRYERRGSTRGQSPRRRRPNGGESRRSRSYRDEEPKPPRTNQRSAYVEEYSDEESDESSNYRGDPRRRSSRRSTGGNYSTIEALEEVAYHHRREADKCKQRTQQLLQSPMTNLVRVQQLLHEIQKHEEAYENAKEQLILLQNSRRRSTQQSQHSNRPRATFTFGTSQFRQSPQDDFESFFSQNSRPQRSPFGQQFMFDDFDAFLQQPFRAHNDFFGNMGNASFFGPGFAHLFTTPGGTFTAGPQPQARSVPRGHTFHSQAGPSMFTAPKPSPPANLLRPEEAKLLFKTYNDRWNSIGPTDPNIPYPARRLHPNGLLARDSIWAPQVSCSISEWSEEVVMQANAQAFYLGVVGLTPHYTETPGSGKVAMGYHKPKATPAQVKQLVDMLKKEKARWHSDRLGRRNAGMEGPNEALQRDNKARAVFHAVCELMEAAQGS